MIDLWRHGRAATRWREYAFLAGCAALAVLYGAGNDLLTSALSWEYFYYGKGLSDALGPTVPPDPAALRWEAAKVGMQATWTVGLLLGAVLLIANNPYPSRHRLPFRKLARRLPPLTLCVVAFSIAGGAAGGAGLLNWVSRDFIDMWRADTFRPHHFMAAWGAHLGGYVGGIVGGVMGVNSVHRERRRPARGAAA